MTRYIAEIRFERETKSKSAESESRKKKRATYYLLSLILIVLLFLTPAFLITDLRVRACPLARICEPEGGSYVSGSVKIQVYASDESFEKAELRIKGTLVKKWTEPGTHAFDWNTTTAEYSDGVYTIQLIAYSITEESSEDTIAVIVDNTPPLIGVPHWSPEEPLTNEETQVSVWVSDYGYPSGVNNVSLWHLLASEWHPLEMTNPNGFWTTTIPGLGADVTVTFYIEAYDNVGNNVKTRTYNYTVKAKPPREYLLLIHAAVGGTTDPPPGIHFLPEGPPLTIRAIPHVGYVFGYWILDGNLQTENPVTLTITSDHNLTAFFRELPPPPFRLTVASTTGGTTDPEPGTYFYPEGISVTVLALPDEGFTFDHWVLDGLNCTTNPISLVLYGEQTLTGHFAELLKLPPVASFDMSPEAVLTGQTIHFNGTPSYDADGYIETYHWNFGDGTVQAPSDSVNHVYTDDGVYPVTLTVTDNNGLIDTVTSPISVFNRPPDASFVMNVTTVLTRETTKFDASASHDSDGLIIGYLWNFGDGTTAVGLQVRHRYTEDGSFAVTLTVIDDDGATASFGTIKNVSNRSPVAAFTENATTVERGVVINYDASESYDLDGTIVGYFWDFGDGTNATGIEVNHAYTQDGEYTIRLTVTDNDGSRSSSIARNTVRSLIPFPLAFLAVIGVAIVVLTSTLLYLTRRFRRKKKQRTPENAAFITIYLPKKLLESNP